MKFKRKLVKLYYKIFYGIKINSNHTHFSKKGKGEFVSVYRKGDYIDIIEEIKNGLTFRLIPYQPNHGIFIECIKDNKVVARSSFSTKEIKKFLNLYLENK